MPPPPAPSAKSSAPVEPGLPAVLNFASTYVARRELVPVIAGRLLAHRGLTIEQAELLLDLYGPWRLDWKVPPCDGDGFVTQAALASALMNSEPHVSRRVLQLAKKKYLEQRKGVGAGILQKAKKVRLTPTGEGLIQGFWNDYTELAEGILRETTPEHRHGHALVCWRVSSRLRPRDFVGLDEPAPGLPEVENLLMIFETARDLRHMIEEQILPETDLTLERADFLVILLLAHPEFTGAGSGDVDAGFMSLGDLQASVVHSISPSKFLMSRWLAHLRRRGLVEVRALDAKRKQVRLTAKGLTVTRPIWARYEEKATELLGDCPVELRLAHLHVNGAVGNALRPFGRTERSHPKLVGTSQ